MSYDGLDCNAADQSCSEPAAAQVFSPLPSPTTHPRRRRAMAHHRRYGSRSSKTMSDLRLKSSTAKTPRVEPPPSAQAPQNLILKHMNLVRQIAHGFIRRMPGHVEVDDLIQAGMVGLLEAARRYCRAEGATFRTYAAPRIRGAILDSMRRSDWTPRSVYRRLRTIEKTKRRLQNESSQMATAADVAAALGMSLNDYHSALQDAAMSRLVSLDGPESDDTLPGTSVDPAHHVEREDWHCTIAAAIAALPERERVIVLLHHDEGLALREIGERFDLSESRACQVHKRAVERIRMTLSMAAAGATVPDGRLSADSIRRP